MTIQLASGPRVLTGVLGAGGSAQVWAVSGAATPDEPRAPALALKVGQPETSRYLASEAERLVLGCSVDLPEPKEVGRLTEGVAPSAWQNAPYLLMTRLPGDSLRKLIAEELTFDDRVQLALAVARDVGRALADLHEAQVAHGDVKPENILALRGGTPTTWQCYLCDLGLSVVGEQLLGATPHYLPPEFSDPALGPSSAVARDLWALGITLLEVLGLGKHTADPRIATLPLPLRTIVVTLLADAAAARPRARWISKRAGAVAKSTEHELAVKRQYLAAHREFLREVQSGAPFEVNIEGIAGEWLLDAAGVLQGVSTLGEREDGLAGVARAEPLSSERRQRFLVALCGVAALDFRPGLTSEESFLQRLLAACAKRPPEGFTSDIFAEPPPTWLDVEAAPSMEAQDEDWVELALAIGGEHPDVGALARAEQHAALGKVSLPFVLAVSNVLKRRGELSRARALLLAYPQGRAKVALAGVLARLGAAEQALTLCKEYSRDEDPTVACAAAALEARLLLARGEIEGARVSVSKANPVPAVLEARASVALSEGNTEQAREFLRQAQSQECDAEQRARNSALLAHLEHSVGNHEAALSGYALAAADASRAGALLEEATYLVGVGAAAGHLGKSDQALAAVQRAELLFEVLGNPAAQARAALNRASNLSVVGAFAEAVGAATEAVAKAREVKDARCEALGHLVLATFGDSVAAGKHLERAKELLAEGSPGDALRLAACELPGSAPGGLDLVQWDTSAAACPDVEIALEWWTGRARQLNQQRPLTDVAGATRVLSALSRLQSASAPVDVVGQAYAAGAHLAANRGDGDRSLQFLAIARRAHERIVEGAPQALKLAARQLPWAAWISRHSAESPLRAEQIGEIERLVRDLADRSQLRAVLERSLDALVRWTGVERGLLLMNAPGDKLVVRAARNLAREDLTPEHRELSQTLARRALSTGDCVVAVDASGELPSLHHSVHSLKLRSVLAVPLSARGDTLGVVYLDDRVRRGAFGSGELAWVRLVSTIVAVAIAEARDQTQLRRAARRAARAEQRLNLHLAKARTELCRAKAVVRPGETGRHGLVGTSPSMSNLYHLIDRVGSSDIPVLIFGESGTGKELVARALHRTSPRAEQPFVSENCSAIPATLLESILFGHKKGAFTGAVQNHVGLFETASGGTLFLDELGEMSLPMQAKLLRVLETGELRRVGDERIIQIDVRVFGASHRNLERMVAEGLFREDLYYRLNVITVHVPPLRERPSDIPELVRHFLRHTRKGKVLPITPAALAALQTYAWPGNVRQLENELRRASVLADDAIGPEHLSPVVFGSGPAPLATPNGGNLRQQVDALETQLIERALREAAGNQSRAAEALGISRFGLQKMLKRLGLTLPK